MIRVLDNLHCDICGQRLSISAEPYVNWSLHEMGRDQWAVVCEPCEDVLELNAGK